MHLKIVPVMLVALAAMASGMASAVPGGSEPPHGQKDRVVRVVKNYFVTRDKGWLDPQQSASSSDDMHPQPNAFSDQPARIAAEILHERGLQAEEVRTGFIGKPEVSIRGHRAEVSITPATRLKWNNADLGESSFSDGYMVALTRTKHTWRITNVAYAPTPSTDEPMAPAAVQARAEPGATTATSAGAGTQAVSYDRQEAARYARHWSGIDWSPSLSERYNPDYDHVWAEHPSEVNDCTNFASQALHAGGWPKVHGILDTVDNWDDDLLGPSRASETWTKAYQLWRFAEESGRAERWKSGTPAETDDIWRLQPGDLLFADWDPNKRPDGRIDHVMVISGSFTELGFTEPTYSQHTPHRNNVPLSIGIKIVTAEPPATDPGTGLGGQGREVVFYPVHVKDNF